MTAVEPSRSSPAAPERKRVSIDLGCGLRKKAGAIGLDIARISTVDVLADVMRPLPLRDDSVDEVYASHLVEHVDNLIGFMEEVWRVCKPNALVEFRFPSGTTNFVVWRDPTHRRGVLLDTFEYFDPTTFNGVVFGYYHSAKFRIVKRRICFNLNAGAGAHEPSRTRRVVGRILDALANRSPRAQYFCERFWGPLVGMEESYIWMRAIKGEEWEAIRRTLPVLLGGDGEPAG